MGTETVCFTCRKLLKCACRDGRIHLVTLTWTNLSTPQTGTSRRGSIRPRRGRCSCQRWRPIFRWMRARLPPWVSRSIWPKTSQWASNLRFQLAWRSRRWHWHQSWISRQKTRTSKTRPPAMGVYNYWIRTLCQPYRVVSRRSDTPSQVGTTLIRITAVTAS